MAADWEKLATALNNPTTLIAEVDCTEEVNTNICAENEVEGFPTLKYGPPSSLENYEGGRDYESLEAFAQENLKPTCSAFNLDLCEGEELVKIESYFAMSVEDLMVVVDAVDEIVAKADEEFEKGLEALQEKYMAMMEEHEKNLEAAKAKAGYKMIKNVMAFKKSQGEAASEGKEEL